MAVQIAIGTAPSYQCNQLAGQSLLHQKIYIKIENILIKGSACKPILIDATFKNSSESDYFGVVAAGDDLPYVPSSSMSLVAGFVTDNENN